MPAVLVVMGPMTISVFIVAQDFILVVITNVCPKPRLYAMMDSLLLPKIQVVVLVEVPVKPVRVKKDYLASRATPQCFFTLLH